MKTKDEIDNKLSEVKSDYGKYIREKSKNIRKKNTRDIEHFYNLGLFEAKIASLKWVLDIDEQVI